MIPPDSAVGVYLRGRLVQERVLIHVLRLGQLARPLLRGPLEFVPGGQILEREIYICGRTRERGTEKNSERIVVLVGDRRPENKKLSGPLRAARSSTGGQYYSSSMLRFI